MNILKEDSRSREIQAISMAVSKSGIFGLFCGPYNLLLINLNDNKYKRKAPINKSLESFVCQWNKSLNETFAKTINNVCKIYDTEINKLHSLKAHNKSISSIDWHPMSANQIATSSIDIVKSLCFWDIRNPKSPSHRIDNQGIFQVKWNKSNSHLFATSFSSEIHLWDDRKLPFPISTIVAHGIYINDLDWHPNDQSVLVSCGKDKKVKIWNFTESSVKPIIEYEDDVGFSRCRFDLLGNILTLSASEASGENQIAYWDSTDFYKLCCTPPSSNPITSFDWRLLSNDSFEFVTLHRNFDFKMWQVDNAICFSKRKRGTSQMTNLDNSVPLDRVFLDPSPDKLLTSPKPVIPTVQSEKFPLLYKNDMVNNMMTHHSDPNLVMRERPNKLLVENQDMLRHREIDKLKNTCQISFEKNFESKSVIAHLSLTNIKCSILFTYRMPLADTLDVQVLQNRTEKMRLQNMEELERILKGTIEDCHCNNLLPIEKCLDAALDYLNKLSSRFSLRSIRSLKEQSNPVNSYCNLPDVKVPFPRVCGATFSPSGNIYMSFLSLFSQSLTGLLVCFLPPPGYMNRFHNIPRSLADVTKHFNPGYLSDMSALSSKNNLHKQYCKNVIRKQKTGEFNMEASGHKLSIQGNLKAAYFVIIYDALPMSLFSPVLAKNYSIDISNVEDMCKTNSMAVAESNRKDLIELWHFCTILVNGCKSSYSFTCPIRPWASQLMGRRLCELWLDHFIKISDIQSAAMMVLVMRAIDIDLKNFMEENFNLTTLEKTAETRKNLSQESLMDNMNNDSMMAHFQMKNYYAYPHTTMSGASARNALPGSGRFRNNSNGELEQINCKKADILSDMILQHNECSRLMDPAKIVQYNRILLHYVHLMNAQNLLSVAAKILQKIMPPTFFNSICSKYNFNVLLLRNCCQDHKCKNVFMDGPGSPVICSECPSRGHPMCNEDLNVKIPLICSICRMPVVGYFAMCTQCNHGGHSDHMMSWFSRYGNQSVCPTGCGCACLSFRDIAHDLSLSISAV